MHFLVPMAIAFAVTIPIVILLYLLKLKRTRVEVSSTILWRKSIEDLMANAPFQRLRRNLLLYLQILALALGTMALMRPFLKWVGFAERNLIVLIDRSASMQSADVPPTRLAAAKEHALRLIDTMGRGDRMAVLAFTDHAQVVQSLTDDRAALRRAVSAIEPSDARTVLAESLAIAKAMARAVARNPEIYVISDGAISDRNLSALDLPSLSFISVGRQADNLGIIDLELRETVGREISNELFVGLRNYGARARQATLRLLLNGALADAKDVTLAAGASQSAIFRNLTAGEGALEVRLDAADDLAADNIARGLLRARKQYEILLVTEGNFFLERFLALQTDFRTRVVKPAGYTAETQRDLVIFDGWSPPSLAPGNYLMLNAAPNLPDVTVSTATIENPAIVDWHRLHPLTRYVNFEPVIIQSALRLKAPSWAQVLAESPEGPMIVLFEDRDVRCLSIAFSVFDSDWPFHVSFPVFLRNAMHWLASQAGAETRLTHQTGETVRVAAPGQKQAAIVRPDGRETELVLGETGEGFFAGTENAGLYGIRTGGKEVGRFAVSLLSEAESNTSPTTAIQFEGRVIPSTAERRKSNVEIWFWLALAALGVLMVEWTIYCRRSSL